MIRLLKYGDISKEFKKAGKRPRKEDYVFCSIDQDSIKVLSWMLYKDRNGNDVYDQWEKHKESSCHYGLQIDKLSNIFNGREGKNENKIENAVHNNIDEYLKESRNLFYNIDFEVKVLNRLIVGLGESTVFETDIKLHHTYGVPYIPGSTLKGCFRTHIIQKYFKCKEENIEKIEKGKWFNSIFGGILNQKTYQGGVIFMDAFPKGTYKICRDIMTPHYQQGYKDDGSINPIEILTVENTSFRFVLRINKKRFLNDDGLEVKVEEKNIRDFIIEEMVEMLTTHGVGAKTSVGYGYFQQITKEECLSQSQKNDENRRKETEEHKEKQKLNRMTESQKKLYLIEKIDNPEKKIEELKRLFTNRQSENLDKEEIIKLAEVIKENLEIAGQWKYILGKKGKENKTLKRIEEICLILNIDLPK
ncbi:type III-B CRISPR module RAMP protein Cmr6 [Desnuesiella massiliensis]|uniref:type III-B CRISPR module RAMP protein Cmr6 n=1 Tax=Desnuesiella massiliensis TaxID=1650662 RepID=UPI000A68BF83|nr:type III-B CRISPR module RAMP protein Cmr6 [Desnuesiella massiliensis]